MTTNRQSDDREAVFARIREALGTARHRRPEFPDTDAYGGLLPAVGDLVEGFSDWLGKLAGEFVVCPNAEALPGCLAVLADKHGWKRPAVDGSELVEGSMSEWKSETEPMVWKGELPEELEKCDVGITGCDALVAQTGSILLSTGTAGGRTLSILPPHHVVIARRDQLVADLRAAMSLIEERYGSGGNQPSMISLHTGPSRTGDIERIMVLGAHGPKALSVIFIEN